MSNTFGIQVGSGLSAPAVTASSSSAYVPLITIQPGEAGVIVFTGVVSVAALTHLQLTRAANIGGTHVPVLTDTDFNASNPKLIDLSGSTIYQTSAGNFQFAYRHIGGGELTLWAQSSGGTGVVQVDVGMTAPADAANALTTTLGSTVSAGAATFSGTIGAVGAATFGSTITGTSLLATGLIKSSGTAGIGYATGAGGAVSQATNRTTGVTLSTICGTITGQGSSLAAGAEAEFTVTNTLVAITDTIILSVQSGPTANTSVFSVSTVAAGSFKIKAHNLHATTADTGAPLINFAVIKGVVS